MAAGLPFRQYAGYITRLTPPNALAVSDGDVQVTCKLGHPVRVDGPLAYPTGKTYYLSLEGDGLPEIGNMRCPKGAILLITPLSAGGKIAVEGGAEALGTSSDGGQTYRITGDFLILAQVVCTAAGASTKVDNYTHHLLGDIKSHPPSEGVAWTNER